MQTVAEIRRANLEHLVEEFRTLEAVAELAGTSPIYLSQIRNRTPDKKTGRPREMGGAIARRLDSGAKKPAGWMDQQHTHAGVKSHGHQVAHELSHSFADAAPTIAWESLMLSPLPTFFKTSVPDDSMAPRVRAGQVVEFYSTSAPRPGDGVLVVDRSGRPYFRLYREGAAGNWEAAALNEGYRPLDAHRDGLRVLGVLVAVQARWG